jgi:uncharacterized Zn finger protein
MNFMMWRPYVPVATRRAQAQKKLAQMKKKGQRVEPVTILGRKIAASFWGKSWCKNLERYSDYSNRLPRGRSYVRNGSVLHLGIEKGKVTALVSGSTLYTVAIEIKPVPPRQWKSVCCDCTGSINSLVELLGGRFEKSVMDRVCREGDGLFPAPKEIELFCSCPDWADMCKHVAATLYGIGARLDDKPELLFVLRGVDANDLLAAAGENAVLSKKTLHVGKTLDENDIADVFGIEMAAPAAVPRRQAAKKNKLPSNRKKVPAARRSAEKNLTQRRGAAEKKRSPRRAQSAQR